jgi:hypothetical protein
VSSESGRSPEGAQTPEQEIAALLSKIRKMVAPEPPKDNPRHLGPCYVCGFPMVVPREEVWGVGDKRQHPWEGMCLRRLLSAVEGVRAALARWEGK